MIGSQMKKIVSLATLLSTFLCMSSCEQLRNQSASGNAPSGCTVGSNAIKTGSGVAVNNINFGGAVAESFQVTQNITSLSSVSLALLTNQPDGFSGPQGNLHVTIESNSSGAPSATVLGEASLAASEITNKVQFYKFSFVGGPALAPNTTYWIVLSADYAVNSTNYVTWAGEPLSNQKSALYYVSSVNSPSPFWAPALPVGTLAGSANSGGQQLAYGVGCN